jgi:hypothetical protein
LLAAAGVLLLGLSHASVFLYAPLLLLLALEAHRRSDPRLAALAALLFGALLLSLPLGLLSSPRYLHDIYAYSFSFLPLHDPAGAGLAAVSLFYLGGLGLALAAAQRRGARARWAALRALWPRVAPLVLAALTMAVALRGYQLGWTRQLATDVMNVGAWTRRAAYAGSGWPALVHLNVVSMVLATSLVGVPAVLSLALLRGRDLVASRLRGLLLAAVLVSLGIYTVLRADTPFNYYASRYFVPVFLPATLLLLGLVPRRLRQPAWLAVGLLIVGLAFNLRYALPLLGARIQDRPLGAVLELAGRLPPGEVLFVNAEPIPFATLAIPLASLRGTPVVRVSRAPGVPARERAERFCAEIGLERAFWLGPDRPQLAWPLAEVALAELEAPERIAYPTAFAALRRTYYLAPLTGACGKQRELGAGG